MKKVLIVGAGAQGGPCASILAQDKTIEEIRVGDISLEQGMAVKKRVGDRRITPMELNAGDIDSVAEAAEDTDIVINLAPIKFNETIMQAAIKSRTHYVDTASEYKYLEAVAGNSGTLKFNEEFNAIGRTAVVGCGMAPGISNVMVRYISDQMEKVDTIVIRLGVKAAHQSDEVVKAWHPGWAPEIALDDYAWPPYVFENGRHTSLPVFSQPEKFEFTNEVGEMLLSCHQHEETYTLPHYIGKGVKNVYFKYPVDPMAGAFVKMGFADDKEIDVQGTRVSPKKVLLSLIPHAGNQFLNETEEYVKTIPGTAMSLHVTVDGEKEGQKVSHQVMWNGSDNPQINSFLYQLFGTAQIGIALPAVVGAKMAVENMITPGVISSECLDPAKFFKVFSSTGLPVIFEEQIVQKKVFA